jgi:hypothetical protein
MSENNMLKDESKLSEKLSAKIQQSKRRAHTLRVLYRAMNRREKMRGEVKAAPLASHWLM